MVAEQRAVEAHPLSLWSGAPDPLAAGRGASTARLLWDAHALHVRGEIAYQQLHLDELGTGPVCVVLVVIVPTRGGAGAHDEETIVVEERGRRALDVDCTAPEVGDVDDRGPLLVVGFGMVLVTYSGSLWFSGLHAYSGL